MKNKYTLITGASQGYGKALAFEFAKRGFNLLLISLPNSGLAQLGNFLRTHFEINLHCLELDLSKQENCYKIAEYIKLNNLKINGLINNAGVLSKGYFEDIDDRYILNQISVNVITPTLLTRLLLPYLKDSKPSHIINISSMASFFSIPKKQVYGATKAYILSFSKSLRKELRGSGISVTSVCPGGLNTTNKLCLQNRKLGWFARQTILNPETAAKITMRHYSKNRKLIFLGLPNKLLMFLNACIPSFLKEMMLRKAM